MIFKLDFDLYPNPWKGKNILHFCENSTAVQINVLKFVQNILFSSISVLREAQTRSGQRDFYN